MRIFLMGASPRLSEAGEFSISGGNCIGAAAAKLAKTGGNTGNQIIAYGLLEALNFDHVSWDYDKGSKLVDNEYDVILIAAANFLHTGFDLIGMARFIEGTNLPCVMVGVGAQSKDYSLEIALQPGTERLMRVVAERSKLIGVRGPFTADVLCHMGINNVQITGCPSYYMGAKPELRVGKSGLDKSSRILFNGSRDVVNHSFDRERMIRAVLGLIENAVRLKADFVAQSELEEIEIAESDNVLEKMSIYRRLMTRFPHYNEVASEEELMDWFLNHMRVYWEVEKWREDMKKYDFVIGNRFHGNMIAIQAGTPACIICHDTRTQEMSEFLGLPHVSIMELAQIDIQDLYDRVDPEAIASRYLELYPTYKAFLVANGLSTRLT